MFSFRDNWEKLIFALHRVVIWWNSYISASECDRDYNSPRRKVIPLAFDVKIDFSTVIATLGDLKHFWPWLHFCTRWGQGHMDHALFWGYLIGLVFVSWPTKVIETPFIA